MRFASLWTIALALVTVSAVLLEDAFSKEAIQHIYGTLKLYSVIKANKAIGFNDRSQFISIQLDNPNYLEWSVELSSFPALNDFHLAQNHNLAYLSSSEQASLYLFETASGVYVREIKLVSPPVKVVDFLNRGLLVLTSNGVLQYVKHESGEVKTVYDFDQPTTILFDLRDGFGSVIAGKLLLKINALAEVVSVSESLPIINAKLFKDGVVVTGNDAVYKFDENGTDVVEITTGKVLNLDIINNNYLYTFTNDSVILYSISAKNNLEVSETLTTSLEIVNVSYENFGLNDFIIVTTKNGRKSVYDLTDFLVLDEPSSIKIVDTKVEQLYTDDFITVFNGNYQLVSIGPDVNGKIFDLSNGHLVKNVVSVNQFVSVNSKYLIIDKPESQQTLNEFHHLLEDANTGFIVTNWLLRVKRHLSELGKYVVSFFAKVEDTETINAVEGDEFGFGKLIIFFEDSAKAIIALNSVDGTLVWKSTAVFDGSFVELITYQDNLVALFSLGLYFINSRDGSVLSFEQLGEEYSGLFKSSSNEEDSSKIILKKENQFSIFNGTDENDLFFVDNDDTTVSGFKISAGDSSSFGTWKFSKSNEKIISLASKPFSTTTSSLGISLANKDVLYKYLNPNVISVLTKDNENEQLKFYLLDAVTGNLLHSFEHKREEVVDFSSINLIMDDNWIIYSYFVIAPSLEQRFNVIDLFDTEKSLKKDNANSVSEFSHNSTIDSYSIKSFIFPERIYGMSSTQSLYGITLKSIIVATENGALIEIPKHLLNSRRIDDRELTQADFQSDFKMIPYEPVIARNAFQILNHKHQLKVTKDGNILTRPTHFESTSVVCYYNDFNQFCTTVQPSSSFDLLSRGFDSVKLLITIAILFAVYLGSKPFVYNKKLNAQWIDRA